MSGGLLIEKGRNGVNIGDGIFKNCTVKKNKT